MVTKNPCLEPSKAYISKPTLTALSYVIDSPQKFFPAHGQFGIVTEPNVHSLCGGITVVPKYEGSPIGSGNNDPMQHEVNNPRQFSALSNNVALQNTIKEYSLYAYFTNFDPTNPLYSTANSVEVKSTIMFDNPCDDPFSFAATPQDDISDNFSGVQQVWDLNPFTIDPARCVIEYACLGVKYLDGEDSSIDCLDLNFDGIFNNSPLDGKILFTATEADYITNNFIPGDYEVTIQGTAKNSLDERTREAKFTLTLIDPCDTPVGFIPPSVANQLYTLTDANADPYTVDDFKVNPWYCPFSLSYEITPLPFDGVSSAISQDETNKLKFSFRYDGDLNVATQFQDVKITATSGSKYGSASPITS